MQGCIQGLQGKKKYGKPGIWPHPTINGEYSTSSPQCGCSFRAIRKYRSSGPNTNLNEGFCPPVVSTPVWDERRNTAGQKLCKRLQKEKRILKKQVLHLRKQLMVMQKLKDKSRKREMRLIDRQRQVLKWKKGQAKYSFCPEMKTVSFYLGKKTPSQKINRKYKEELWQSLSLSFIHSIRQR